VGSLQAIGAVVMAVVSASAVVHTGGSAADLFSTVVAAIMVATVLTGLVALWLGARRRGDLIRFVPYPVVGGFIAGTGWLLAKAGVYVAAGGSPFYNKLGDLIGATPVQHWAPALAFGVVLLIADRTIRRPLVIPAVIAIGLVVFVVAMIATGSSVDDMRADAWLLGSFDSGALWKTWTFNAVTGADWIAVLKSFAAILAAVFVATISILFNVNASEQILDRGLDTNRELRDAGVVNVVSGALGGIPGYHSLSFTALVDRMRVDARATGLIAALVPLTALVVGADVVELIPRVIVGGVLVFLGLGFIVEWVWDKRHVLPRLEYWVVWVILIGVIVLGYLIGIILGLVLAVVLFAISYGRIELVREVAFGETYHSNVDRPTEERAELMTLGDQVQILRISGFVFFGSTSRLLERVQARVERTPPRFLVIDLRHVTGVDSSAVVSFVKVSSLAQAHGFQVILTGATDRVRAQLTRGGVDETGGIAAFVPDLDHGLQRCEEALLSSPGLADAKAGHPSRRGPEGLPPALSAHADRVVLEAGDVLIHQDDPPGDVFVLVSGRLGIETTTPEGTRLRLRTLRPGVVVGEITLYTGVARTADVVAETHSVVLRIGREAIERLEAEAPETAAMLHRWLATMLAERLTDSMRTIDVLLDR
jgi:SulP family sulfate permease